MSCHNLEGFNSQKNEAIELAITDIESEATINNRLGYYFGQDQATMIYVNQIMLILYYIVFLILALSFYLNRELYSIFLIVICLVLFGLLPFVIKFITNYSYERFLDLSHMFYNGNARYLGQKAN